MKFFLILLGAESAPSQDPNAGRCGPSFGNRHCENGCCSQYSWCATGKAWCGCRDGCDEAYGVCGTDNWWQHKAGTHVCPPSDWWNTFISGGDVRIAAQRMIYAQIPSGSPDGARNAMWSLVLSIPQTTYEEVDSVLQEMKKIQPDRTLTDNAICLSHLHYNFPLDSLPSFVDGLKRLEKDFDCNAEAISACVNSEENLTFLVVVTTLLDLKPMFSDDCTMNELGRFMIFIFERFPDLRLSTATSQLKLLKSVYGTINLSMLFDKFVDIAFSEFAQSFQDLISLLMKIRQKTACQDSIYEVVDAVRNLHSSFPSALITEMAGSIIDVMNAYDLTSVQPVVDALNKCATISNEHNMKVISTELITFRAKLKPPPTLQVIVNTISGLEKQFGSNYPSLQALMNGVMDPLSALQNENKMSIDTITADIETLRVFQAVRPVTIAELTDGVRALEQNYKDDSFISIVQSCVEIAKEIPSLAFQDLVASTKALHGHRFQSVVKASISVTNTFPNAPFDDVLKVLMDLAGSSTPNDLIEDAKWFNSIAIKTANDEPLKPFCKKLQDFRSHWNIDGQRFVDTLMKLISATPRVKYILGSARDGRNSLDEPLLSLQTDATAATFLSDVDTLATIAKHFPEIENLTPVAKWLARERSVSSLQEGAETLSLLGKANYRKHYDTFDDFLHQVDVNFGRIHAAWPSVLLLEYAQVLSQVARKLATTELITMDHLVNGVLRVHVAFPEVSFQALARDLPKLSQSYTVHFLELCEDIARAPVPYQQLITAIQSQHGRVWSVALANASGSYFFHYAYRIVFCCAIVAVVILMRRARQDGMRSYAVQVQNWSTKHFEQYKYQCKVRKSGHGENDIYGTFGASKSAFARSEEMSVLL